MHFFIHTDNNNISIQGITDAFGTDSGNAVNKFNITSRFQLTGTTKAFACQDGLMIVQQSSVNNSLVNVILKPIKGLKITFRSVKYFIYRGLLKSSFITGTSVKSQSDADRSEFIDRFWTDWKAFKKSSNQPGLPDPAPQSFGYDSILSNSLNIEKIYDNSQTETRALFVKEGEWIGDFTNNYKIGFEIITETDNLPVDLNYVRAEKYQVDVTGLSGLELRSKKEQILSFIDPAAFFGLHYHVGVSISLYNGKNKIIENKKGNDLSTLLLGKFATKNRVYLDIRSEHGYSYNFYQNYDNGSGKNIKIGNSATAPTEQNYSTNGWPLIFVDTPLVTSASNNDIKINLRIDDNTKPILFFQDTKLSGSGNTSRFIDETKILNGSGWSKDLSFVFPNTGTGSGKDNVAYYLQIHYFRKTNPSASLPLSVLKTENYVDNIFGNIDNPDIFQEKPFLFVEFGDTKFPNGQYNAKTFGYVQERNAYYDADSIVFTCANSYTHKNSEEFFTEIVSGVKFQISLASDTFKNSLLFKKTYFEQILIEEQISSGPNPTYETIPLISFVDNGLFVASKENIFLLNISKTEFEKQKAVSGFSPFHRRYCNLEQLFPSGGGDSFTDKNGLPYFKYKLVVQGLDPLGNNLKKSLFDDTNNPADDVFVYSADNLVFSSKLFLQNKISQVSIPYQSPDQYDEFKFQVTIPELPNTFQIAQFFRGLSNNKTPTEADLISLNKKLNNKFDATLLHKGDIIYLPKGTLSYINNLGGNLTSSKIILVAWTFDDGPTAFTEKMLNVLGRIKAVTWYIMLTQLKQNILTYSRLKEIQNSGGEFAIHSMHPSIGHVSWFPGKNPSPGKIDLNFYSSIQNAMTDLKTFYDLLTNNGIKIKFVRPPYGLYSELFYYLYLKGYDKTPGSTDPESANQLARKIIRGENVSGNANIVKQDYEYMKGKLQEYGLHLGITEEIQPLDWNAESSGTSLTDNVTLHPKNEKYIPSGVFESKVRNIFSTSLENSLVVLTHDTGGGKSNPDANVHEVGQDIKQMDYYASFTSKIISNEMNPRFDMQSGEFPLNKDGVKIEYNTISKLFKHLRGVEP